MNKNMNQTKLHPYSRSVSIIGVGCTPFMYTVDNPETDGLTEGELFGYAALKAMEDAGITPKDVDYYFHGEAKMTASDEEIEEAMEEGIFVHPAQSFEGITGQEHVTGANFMNVTRFYFDENHRAVTEKEPGSLHHIEADTVIFATGQRPDITPDAGLTLGRGNSITVRNMDTDKTTSVPGIFAAGDCIYGTKSVIQAIQSGREAASQIDRFLGGDGDISEVLAPVEKPDPWMGQCPGFGSARRKFPVMDPAQVRQTNFNVYDHGISDGDIRCEASRCLQCDLRLEISKPHLWADYAEAGEGREQ